MGLQKDMNLMRLLKVAIAKMEDNVVPPWKPTQCKKRSRSIESVGNGKNHKIWNNYPFKYYNCCSIKQRPIGNITVSSNPTTVGRTPKRMKKKFSPANHNDCSFNQHRWKFDDVLNSISKSTSICLMACSQMHTWMLSQSISCIPQLYAEHPFH